MWHSYENVNLESTDPLSIATTQRIPDIERKFMQLVSWWRSDTLIATLPQMFRHPAYEAMISLGWPAVPYILAEMNQRPGHWFVALHAITGIDPSPEGATFDEAVVAWMAWGRSQELI
jgi:hypothetical protein